MRKKLVSVAMMGLLLVMGACGAKEKDKKTGVNEETVVENLSFESYKFERIGEFEDSDSLAPDGERFVRFISEGVLPRDLGTGGAGLLRDSLMRMARVVMDEDGKPAPLMPDSMITAYNIPDSILNCGFVYTSLSTTLMTPRVVVWEVDRETYAYHAAHANRFTGFVNYNLTNGKIINLSDIIKEGAEKQLTALVRDKIKEEEIQLLVEPSEIELPKAFAITSDGLLFSFNPYAIAPYSEGIVKVDLSLDEVYDFLSPNGLFLLTGNKD